MLAGERSQDCQTGGQLASVCFYMPQSQVPEVLGHTLTLNPNIIAGIPVAVCSTSNERSVSAVVQVSSRQL